MKDFLIFGNHVISLIHYLYVLIFVFLIDVEEVTDPYLKEAMYYFYGYVTLWSVTFQMIYLILSLLIDYRKISGRDTEKLFYIKGYFFTSIVFPLSFFACFGYWIVVTIQRDWIVTPAMDEMVPEWLQHSTHTIVMIPLVFDIIFDDLHFPEKKSAMIGHSIMVLSYGLTFVSTYFLFERWLYNMFNIFDWPTRWFAGGLFLLLFWIGFETGVQMQKLKQYLRKSSIAVTRKNLLKTK